MKTLKTFSLAILFAVSMGTVSTAALAGAAEQRTVYSPSAAIDMTLKKVLAAQNAIETGEDPEQVALKIQEATDASKEINANDKVDVRRQRANTTLRKAKGFAKKGDLQEADAELRKAVQEFTELKKYL